MLSTVIFLFFGCYVFLYSWKHSWALFWDVVKLLRNTLILLNLAFFFFCLLSFGGSKARESKWSCCCWTMPEPQYHQIQATSVTYTKAHGNTGSLTQWVRPEIESASSWILIRFVCAAPQWELLGVCTFWLPSSTFSSHQPLSLGTTTLISLSMSFCVCFPSRTDYNTMLVPGIQHSDSTFL